MTRTKKVQKKTTISGELGRRATRIVPALELSGNWFTAAGFSPGQLVSIEARTGQIIISLQ